MKKFNEYSSGTILIGVLVLWLFIGMIINSISDQKKTNDGDLKGGNTKHSKKNRTPAKHIKENRKSTNLVFFYVMGVFIFFVNLFNVFVTFFNTFIMVILPFFFWCLSMAVPIILLLLIYWIFF